MELKIVDRTARKANMIFGISEGRLIEIQKEFKFHYDKVLLEFRKHNEKSEYDAMFVIISMAERLTPEEMIIVCLNIDDLFDYCLKSTIIEEIKNHFK